MNYKQRVLNEFVELNYKLENLKVYMSNNRVDELLDKQFKLMNEYSQVLYERLMNMLEDRKEELVERA